MDIHELMEKGGLTSAAGDEYFTRLEAQMLADNNPRPAVVLTEVVDGQTVRVLDVVAPGATDDEPLRRGFMWIAVVGKVTVGRARRVGGKAHPATIRGDSPAHSTLSAQDAMDQAIAALRRRANRTDQ